MALRAPKKRPIVSRRYSGEPKGRKVSPQLFQGLELWPYVRYLISLPQIPPSGLVPLTEVSIHPDAFTLSQATQSRPVFVPHNPCTSFKDACYLQTFGAEKLEAHTSDQEKTRSRLFSITRGGGLVPTWRHFFQHPLLQNGPFYEPG